MDESVSSASFRDDVQAYLDMTSHTTALQAENEELKIRLETLGGRLGGIWDEVECVREELEVRIGRLELQRRGEENASPAQITATRRAECVQYDDTWEGIKRSIEKVKKYAQGAQDKTGAHFIDEFELDWVRSALERHLRGNLGDGAGPLANDSLSSDEEVILPPQPAAPVVARALLRKDDEEERGFEDATRVLRVSVQSFQSGAEVEGTCVVQVDTHCRTALTWRAGRRATQMVGPLTFLQWSPNSICRVSLTLKDSKMDESASFTVKELIAARDTAVALSDGEIMLRVEVGTSALPHVFASKHLLGPQDRKTRGGAHISVPRFVKKLKSLRTLRDAYSKGDMGGQHAATVEEEFIKPLPDLNWLHEQVADGWDGKVVMNSHNQTLLHVVAMVGTPRAVRSLLKKGSKWDPHHKDANGWTPFLLMVARQFIEGVQIMLFNGARANDAVWGVSSMHLAALSGNVELVKVLLEHDSSLAIAIDDKFATPLHYAAYGHRNAVIQLLLARPEVDPGAKDLDGHTPLLTAILRRAGPVMQLLLAAGARVEHAELWAAASCQHPELLSILVENADLSEALLQHTSSFGHGVLARVVIFLSDFECIQIIPLLLQKQYLSVLDDVCHNRRSALMYAIMFGKVNTVRLLIDLGADTNACDIMGNTIAHLTTTSAVFDVLEDAVGSLSLDSRNMFGWTPLDVARALQATDVCSAMEAAGAKATEKPETPLVASWKYRILVPFEPGTPNNEFLV